MFEHILVPLDGSTRAEAALPIAARIARAMGSSVGLIQVVSIPASSGYRSGPDVNYGYGGGLGMSYGYGGNSGLSGSYSNDHRLNTGYSGALVSGSLLTEQERETEQADAAEYLTSQAHSDQFAGITTTTEVVFGHPASEILSLVEQQGINLVVLCSHGRTGFLRWVLGSVAQRVIHHSRVPVLVLHEQEAIPSALHAEAARPLCIAVALDGSPLAETALLPAAHLIAALAQHTQGVVHLLHVVKPHLFAANADVRAQRSAQDVEHAQAYLQRVREHLLMQTRDLNLQITWSATPAQDVAEAIVTSTEKGTGGTGGNVCDVLAITTHGHGDIERWVMGSVTERILEASTMPVLVIRPTQDALHT